MASSTGSPQNPEQPAAQPTSRQQVIDIGASRVTAQDDGFQCAEVDLEGSILEAQFPGTLLRMFLHLPSRCSKQHSACASTLHLYDEVHALPCLQT
jgi:hypothetical protein